MTIDRNTLKQWFSKGKKPLESHFASWIDSFWHKSDKINMSSIDRLPEALAEKIDKEALNDYQTKEAPTLNTEAKTIVEAINEVNDKEPPSPLVINEEVATATITANLAAHVHSVSYTGTATQLTISATNAATCLCSILAITNDTDNDITVITPTTLDTLPVDSVQKQLSTVIKPGTATEYNFILINNRLRLLIV